MNDHVSLAGTSVLLMLVSARMLAGCGTWKQLVVDGLDTLLGPEESGPRAGFGRGLVLTSVPPLPRSPDGRPWGGWWVGGWWAC